MRQGLSPCGWRHTVAVVISYQMRKLDSTASAASDSMATMKAACLPLTGAGDFVLWTCHHRLSASLSLPLSVYLLLSVCLSIFLSGLLLAMCQQNLQSAKTHKTKSNLFSPLFFYTLLPLSSPLSISFSCLVSIFQFFECLSRQQFQIFLGNWIAVFRSSVSTTCNTRRGEARLINNAHSTRN